MISRFRRSQYAITFLGAVERLVVFERTGDADTRVEREDLLQERERILPLQIDETARVEFHQQDRTMAADQA